MAEQEAGVVLKQEKLCLFTRSRGVATETAVCNQTAGSESILPKTTSGEALICLIHCGYDGKSAGLVSFGDRLAPF